MANAGQKTPEIDQLIYTNSDLTMQKCEYLLYSCSIYL